MTADDRTHSILHGQTAPRAGHGVRILWRCPSCNRPWLQDPRLPHGCRIRLSNEDALRVAREVHATLDDLPRATCRLCCYAAGGELSIDQYGAGDGFGLSWEGVQPPGMHLLGAVFSVAWAERQREMLHPGIVTQPRRLRAFLEWLAALPDVPEDGVMDAETGAHLARTTRPGHGAPGTQGWVWRGIAACLVPCRITLQSRGRREQCAEAGAWRGVAYTETIVVPHRPRGGRDARRLGRERDHRSCRPAEHRCAGAGH